MRAVALHAVEEPPRLTELPVPQPTGGQVLIRVSACGVCRTDLHIVDGDVAAGHLPLVLGHQIIGTREDTGERVGVPWLGWTCGECAFCTSGRENLCPRARFTGCHIDGGYAEYAVADERYCLPIPHGFDDLDAAPLLCAGLIGYRTLRLAGDAQRLGIYGFGSAAHVICQVAVHEGREVYAFTRRGDAATQEFARDLGAVWAGASDARSPEALDAALIFAPDGALVPHALRAVRPGGTVVCGGIHMSAIPSFPYSDLWGERVVRSVANLTREDGVEFLRVAARVPVRTRVTAYALEETPRALEDLRAGQVRGSAVVTV